ncbi:MAG: GTP pyrophosphokinase [Deltaproteobacteria bacterium]
MTPEALSQRAVRFYSRYGDELESIRQLLHIQLDQLALASTLENGLPRKAIRVVSRTKELKNFLLKLARKGWPEFYLPTEVIHDLVGARIVCWFHDDCYAMLNLLRESQRLTILPDSIEDYNENPKPSGYRAIHVLADVTYDQVVRKGKKHEIVAGKMTCEIQIRTLFQDAWGELTHQMHYKIDQRERAKYNELVSTLADHLFVEDKAAMAIREVLKKAEPGKPRTGFKSK